MVKLSLLCILATFSIANIFETNCVACHTDKSELKLFMANYTLKYSSAKNIKKAMFKFLRSPTSNRSIMPSYYIKEVGFKEKSNLNATQLKSAIDQYYKKYKLSNFIK